MKYRENDKQLSTRCQLTGIRRCSVAVVNCQLSYFSGNELHTSADCYNVQPIKIFHFEP